MKQNNDIIKPVEKLPNIGSVIHAEKQGDRKQQKNLRQKNEKQQKPDENNLNETVTVKNDSSEKNNEDRHAIDYCA
jgi:sRNA-binding protein